MNEITKIADHASMQTDRWLLIAVMITSLVLAVWIWRWVIADREKTAIRLAEMTDRHIQTTKEVTEVVANNTVALNSFKETLQRIKG